MSRFTPRHLLVLCVTLAASGLMSCFHDVTDECPTCPVANTSRIEVVVTKNGLVDSVHASVDGGSQVTVRRDRRHAFTGLSRGVHTATVTRWFFTDGLVTSRTATLRIRLERGEARTIVFHNDFPLVTRGPAPAPDRLAWLRGATPRPPRRG